MDQKSAGVLTDQAESDWETAHISAPSRPGAAAILRHQVMEFLKSSPFSSEELADVELAVGEASSNALKYGSPKGELDEVTVKCMKNEHTLIVEISDNGGGFDPEAVSPLTPDGLAEGGMGIFLMRALMDTVEFEFRSGTTVRLTKRRRRGQTD